MPEFQLPVDIGNRACQHVGVAQISRVQGFAENSKAAKEIGFAYGKLRRAELRRNPWVFSLKRTVIRAIDVTTMLVAPALWSGAVTYYRGSIVADAAGTLWVSRIPNNLNFEPLSTPAWEPYFGAMTASLYATTTSYFAGELAYTAAGDGTNRVYLSLQDGNTDNPATATAWDATATYHSNQVVTYLSVPYMSLIDLNIGQVPSFSPLTWDVLVAYNIGDTVSGSDGVIYSSLGSGNLGFDPTSDGGVHWLNTGTLTPWTSVFVGGTGSLKWLEVGGTEFPSGVTLTTTGIIYPIGAGPSSQAASRNVYRLPANFLRRAPQDPKAGSFSALGAPSNRAYDDWNFEGSYLVSQMSDSIALRFVADVADVTLMDDMFCEGLGARVGLEVCESLTQSTQKKAACAQAYARFMTEARTVNAIEAGSEEPPLDDYLACRL